MRIFFTANPQENVKTLARCERIVEALSEAGVLVSSSLEQFNRADFSNTDLERIGQGGNVLMERVDGVVIEGSFSLPDVGYVVAMALAFQKPILYVVENVKQVDPQITALQKQKSATQFLEITASNDERLTASVMDFIARAERGTGREYPNIKFTLRITPRIERYLQWKTLATKLSKADWLRNVVEEMMEDDVRYQKFLGQDTSKK